MSKSRNGAARVLSYVLVGLVAPAVTLIMLGINPLLDSTTPPPPITERSIIPQLEVVANIIEARGNISDKEMRALKFLSTEAKPGDSIETFKEFLNNN